MNSGVYGGAIYSNRPVNPPTGRFVGFLAETSYDVGIVPRSAQQLRRIGLFGGTFDPPHVGHMVTAVNVRHALSLDLVILMVANVPWQKEGTRVISPALDRLAMVDAAVSDVPGLLPGRHEIEHGGPSYTADTLSVLSQEYPDAELFTIIGDDAAAGLHTWTRWDEVVAQSQLVVVDRPGDPVELDDDIDWIRVEVPRLEVSSTDLRARFTDGRPLDYLVTPPVLDLIRARSLYAEGPVGVTDGLVPSAGDGLAL